MTTPIRRRNSVLVEYFVADALRGPLDADGGVTVTLYDPPGNVVVAAGAMTRARKGGYVFRYQTSADSPLGVWTSEAVAVHQGATGISDRGPAFELVA